MSKREADSMSLSIGARWAPGGGCADWAHRWPGQRRGEISVWCGTKQSPALRREAGLPCGLALSNLQHLAFCRRLLRPHGHSAFAGAGCARKRHVYVLLVARSISSGIYMTSIGFSVVTEDSGINTAKTLRGS